MSIALADPALAARPGRGIRRRRTPRALAVTSVVVAVLLLVVYPVGAAMLLAGGVRYTGVDYSDAMIARARARSPRTAFEVADATRLPYADGAFDIVFNGVSLMHVVDYPAVIREAARVAKSYCIFHTVPVFLNHRTTFLRKYAYGAPVVEVVFGKTELMTLCREAGLRLEREWPSIPYNVSEATGHQSTAETYLFSR